MSRTDIDVAIVGGGILGLWTAYELLSQNKSLQVAVFEQEMYLGEHTTSRNSEVLHAGIYYDNQSLKHLHCLAGNQLWRKFISDFEIPFFDCGKFIVAKNNELESLDTLVKKAKKNQVLDLREASLKEVVELKNYIHLDAAIFSKSSGVLDVSSSLKILRNEIEKLGGIILTKSKLTLESFSDYLFQTKVNNDSISARFLINCAGLHAVDFRKSLGLIGFTNFYVKGNYLQLNLKYPAQNLIYPIPPKDGLGLGVHLTLDVAGRAKFGPNTLPVESLNYAVPIETKSMMLNDIQNIFYTVKESELSLGYSGIRPKVKKSQEVIKDFVIQSHHEHGIKGYIEMLGIESPGLTAAPSLAKLVASRVLS